jgi:hypothetical protein
MKKQTWIVTTDGKRDHATLTRELQSAGFSVTQAFSDLPSVIGVADTNAVAKIRKVKGVVDVSPDAPVDVGPPGSKETW